MVTQQEFLVTDLLILVDIPPVAQAIQVGDLVESQVDDRVLFLVMPRHLHLVENQVGSQVRALVVNQADSLLHSQLTRLRVNPLRRLLLLVGSQLDTLLVRRLDCLVDNPV